MSFTVQDLTLALGGRPVLRGLSFSLPAQGITGIIGANGSGKTTLLRCLAGVQPADSGQIWLDGTPIGALSPRHRARRVALLPQTSLAPPGLSVRQLVARGRTPWLRPFLPMAPQDHTAVDRALSAVGLSDLATRKLDSLSGGQRQRAWIALVLAQESRTVLLDEPLNFLDLPHQADLVNLLRKLRQTRKIVMILHDLTIASRVCDHVLALRDGGLVASGSAAQVLAPQPLAQTFGIGFDVHTLPAGGGTVVLPQTL